jgi:hypothetical protein
MRRWYGVRTFARSCPYDRPPSSSVAWIANAAQESGRAGRIRVGFPKVAPDYFRLMGPLRNRGIPFVELGDGQWFADPPDFFVLPEWYEIAITRDVPDSPAAQDLERLRSGAAGYVAAARWSSSYSNAASTPRSTPPSRATYGKARSASRCTSDARTTHLPGPADVDLAAVVTATAHPEERPAPVSRSR